MLDKDEDGTFSATMFQVPLKMGKGILASPTLDGIKRRTRSGMGRCQGGFCTPRLIEMLSSELGLPPEQFLLSRKTAPKALRQTTPGNERPDSERIYDVVVIGAEPAGLAAILRDGR